MGYKVIKPFSDVQDFHHIYRVGDVFPRTGMEVTEARLKELSGKNNKQKQPLIAKVGDDFGNYMNPPKVPEVTYTKTEVNRLSTAELKAIAKSLGIKDSETKTGAELKKILIEIFGL